MRLLHFAAFRALCLAFAFATAAGATETLWESRGEYVKIAPRDGGTANQHPLKIDRQLLAQAFSKLRVEPGKKQSKELLESGEEPEIARLFTPATAHRIANYVADGLRDAGPDDDVVFRSVDTAPLLGKLLGKQVFVTGRVFWRNRHLHVIFGKIHKNIKKRWLLGKEQGYLNAPEPGARGKAAALKLRIVEGAGISNAKTRDGKKRLDWVMIEPRALARSEPASRRPAPPARDRSTKARLKRLERLRKEGVITGKEYKTKRKEILDEL